MFEDRLRDLEAGRIDFDRLMQEVEAFKPGAPGPFAGDYRSDERRAVSSDCRAGFRVEQLYDNHRFFNVEVC